MNAAHWGVRPGRGKLLAALVCMLLCGGVLLPGLAATACAADVDAYFARKIWTGDGSPIQDGVMVVSAGKITAIGPRDAVEIPEGATRHELGNKVLIPGLVIAQTSLADNSSDVERALTPQISALDGFNFFADRTAAFTGGVTTVQLSPGASRLVSGIGAVVKLIPGDKSARVLNDHESLRVVLTDASRNPPTIYEPPVGPVSEDRPLLPTRPQLSKSLAGAGSGLRSLFHVARERERTVQTANEVVQTDNDIVMEALVSHLAANGVVRFTANTPAEIRLAMEIAGDAKLTAILVDPSDLRDQAENLGAWNSHLSGVVLQGLRPGEFNSPAAAAAKREVAPWESARELVDAGYKIAVHPANDDDLQDMLFIAGQFMQDGLTPAEALNAVTRWPAELMGVADQVGQLAIGHDADFVVLTDDPFALHSTVWSTYADGEIAFAREPAERTTVIRVGSVYTGDGRVVNGGSVVVKGKTLRGLGEDVSAPLDATIKEYPNAVIVPGFVDLGATVGTGGASPGNNVNLQTKLGEQIDANDPAIEVARQTGVTTVLLSGGGNGPAPLVAFKLGPDARVIADPVAVRFNMTGNLATTVPSFQRALAQGKAYHEQWQRYETALAEYEARQKNKAADSATQSQDNSADDNAADNSGDEQTTGRGEGNGAEDTAANTLAQDGPQGGRRGRGGQETGTQDGDAQDGDGQDGDQDAAAKKEKPAEDTPPPKPNVNAALEPYRALFSGKIPAFVEARQSNEIEAALQLFRRENDIKTVLIGVDDLTRFPDMLDGQDVMVCAGPDMLIEQDGVRMNIPQMLANDRINFGFQSQATTGVRDLPRVVQFAVSQGLGSGDALKALTAGAAQMLSDSASFGKLEVGKDADLVILSGPPFELSTKVLAVMIDGQWVYEKEDGR